MGLNKLTSFPETIKLGEEVLFLEFSPILGKIESDVKDFVAEYYIKPVGLSETRIKQLDKALCLEDLLIVRNQEREIVGCLASEIEDNELGLVAVCPKYQRRGLALQMGELVVSEMLKQANDESIEISTRVQTEAGMKLVEELQNKTPASVSIVITEDLRAFYRERKKKN